MKIYVHHLYTKPLFYKLAHNTTDRIEDIQNQKGTIYCKYNDLDLEIVFNDEIHQNDDGLHIFDISEYYRIRTNNNLNVSPAIDNKIFSEIIQKLNNVKNWLILFFYTEKLFVKHENIDSTWKTDYFEEFISLLETQNIILTDQFFLNKEIEKKYYSTHRFLFTNTIFHWNEWASIRFYYEFKNIFDKITPPYDIAFSVFFHKVVRVNLICELAKLNNPRIFLSRKSPLKLSGKDYRVHQNPLIMDNYSNIFINDRMGDNFDDISLINNRSSRVGLDLYFRLLPMSKIQILAESWDWSTDTLNSMFLSEKTYGILLANIPFIPTHTYPLDIIQTILNLDEYPFYNEIKNIRGNQIEFAKFIETFLENFDNNLFLLKEWTNIAHIKMMDKINSENSMLNLIIDNSIKITNQHKRSLL